MNLILNDWFSSDETDFVISPLFTKYKTSVRNFSQSHYHTLTKIYFKNIKFLRKIADPSFTQSHSTPDTNPSHNCPSSRTHNR